jgi:predicted negative regulator of RcsB-dependent stress response
MYDLEEQEKIDALKGWWQENRVTVLAVVIAGLASYGGMTAWKAWKAHQAEQAAQQFAIFQATAAGGDAAKLVAAAKGIEEASPSSPFAARAALSAAQALAGAGKTAEAQVQYQWVVDHSTEVQLQSIARIRLAGVLADAQKFDDALHALETGIDPAFAALAGDRKGDILLSQGKTGDARAAYKLALDVAEGNHPLRPVLQSKLDALGGAQ